MFTHMNTGLELEGDFAGHAQVIVGGTEHGQAAADSGVLADLQRFVARLEFRRVVVGVGDFYLNKQTCKMVVQLTERRTD